MIDLLKEMVLFNAMNFPSEYFTDKRLYEVESMHLEVQEYSPEEGELECWNKGQIRSPAHLHFFRSLRELVNEYANYFRVTTNPEAPSAEVNIYEDSVEFRLFMKDIGGALREDGTMDFDRLRPATKMDIERWENHQMKLYKCFFVVYVFLRRTPNGETTEDRMKLLAKVNG
jgi:hypothetical protein